MKIITWNVNGIRAAYKKGLIEFIERENPDIFCVQETKATMEQCEPLLVSAAGRVSHWSSSVKRKGYSGVATFSRTEPKSVLKGLGIPDYDDEGRVIITEHDDFKIYNIYFPNGGSGDERHVFKQAFLRDLNLHLGPKVKNGEKIIVVGDYNVAHLDYDVHDPVRLSKISGFLPEERVWIGEFFKLGFVDCYRHFHPDVRDKYTWWDMRTMARPGNRGWRIDYISVTKNLVPRLKSAEIMDWQQGSDHCPVVIEMT
jgi:exodeoxyribonuclease III